MVLCGGVRGGKVFLHACLLLVCRGCAQILRASFGHIVDYEGVLKQTFVKNAFFEESLICICLKYK